MCTSYQKSYYGISSQCNNPASASHWTNDGLLPENYCFHWTPEIMFWKKMENINVFRKGNKTEGGNKDAL